MGDRKCRSSAKTKELCKIMTWEEVQEYLAARPHWRLPTIEESTWIEFDHPDVWTIETLGDRQAIMTNKYGVRPSHLNMKRGVLLLDNTI